jgi:hypothetical protein
VFKSVSWRRTNYISNANKATTFNMNIKLSNSKTAYNAPSSTYLNNHGKGAVTVYNGKVSLPANTRGTWPEPWFMVASFTTIYAHIPINGGSLVAEFISTLNSSNQTYYCEGFGPDSGTRTTNVQSGGCQYTSEGSPRWNSGIGYRQPVVGGTWYVNHSGYPPAEPNLKKSLNLIGFQGNGGTAYGLKLPIPITKLGFLDVCKTRAGILANDVVMALITPMTYTPSTAGPGRGAIRTITFNIPNDPKVGGLNFFQQPISADKPLNGFDQIYMGWPSKWHIGTGMGPMGSYVGRAGNNSLLTGFIGNGRGRTMKFN